MVVVVVVGLVIAAKAIDKCFKRVAHFPQYMLKLSNFLHHK